MQTIINPITDLTLTIYEDPQCFSRVLVVCLKCHLAIVQNLVVE